MHETEHLKPFPENPDYWVTSDGKIFSTKGRTLRELKLVPHNNGYLVVSLWKSNKGRNVEAHYAVLRTFVGPRPPGLDVRHLDGDTSNNSLTNLRWGTKQENEEDKRRHGTTARGSRNGNSTLSEQQVLEIRELLAAGHTQKSVGEKFGIHKSTVSLIARGKTWA